MIRHAFALMLCVGAAICALSGCNGLGNLKGGGNPPTTSPSSSPTATPITAPCHTKSPAANLVVVGISSQIGVMPTASPFNSIYGYSVGSGGTYSALATLISQTASGGPITPSNVVQFTNVETYAAVNHSAVGFSGNAFPPQPYAFPSPAASPTNATIGNGFWSTGRIPAAGSGGQCFSQVFTLRRGVFFFGDLDYYNSATSFRDALIVGTPSPAPLREGTR